MIERNELSTHKIVQINIKIIVLVKEGRQKKVHTTGFRFHKIVENAY